MKRKTYERNRRFTGEQSESLLMNKRELKRLIRKQTGEDHVEESILKDLNKLIEEYQNNNKHEIE